MTDIPTVDAGQGAGPQNIEIRFTMREILLLHGALQFRHETLAKDAWWASKRGNSEKASRLDEQARETIIVADRLFATLSGIMDAKS